MQRPQEQQSREAVSSVGLCRQWLSQHHRRLGPQGGQRWHPGVRREPRGRTQHFRSDHRRPGRRRPGQFGATPIRRRRVQIRQQRCPPGWRCPAGAPSVWNGPADSLTGMSTLTASMTIPRTIPRQSPILPRRERVAKAGRNPRTRSASAPSRPRPAIRSCNRRKDGAGSSAGSSARADRLHLPKQLDLAPAARAFAHVLLDCCVLVVFPPESVPLTNHGNISSAARCAESSNLRTCPLIRHPQLWSGSSMPKPPPCMEHSRLHRADRTAHDFRDLGTGIPFEIRQSMTAR